MSKRAGTAVIRAHRLDTAKPNRYTYITPWAKVSFFAQQSDPHLQVGSGQHDKAEDVAEHADGHDDVSHHAVSHKLDLLNCLMVHG